MAQDLIPKLRGIAGDSVAQAKATLQAIDALVADADVLGQTGGNFTDAVFDVPQLSHLSTYQANVFLQVVVPAVDAFLDSHIQGDTGQPTYREYFQTMVAGAY